MSVTTGLLKIAFAAAIVAGPVGTVAATVHDVKIQNLNNCYFIPAPCASDADINYVYSGPGGSQNPTPPPGLNNFKGWLPLEIPAADVIVLAGLSVAIKKRKWREASPNQKLFNAVADENIDKVQEALDAGANVNAISTNNTSPLDIIARKITESQTTIRINISRFGTPPAPPTLDLESLSTIWNMLVDKKAGLLKYGPDSTFQTDTFIKQGASAGSFKAPRVRLDQ